MSYAILKDREISTLKKDLEAKDKRIAELDLHSNGLQIKVSQLLKLNENLHKISTETGQRIKELEAQVEKMRKEHEHIAKREEHICEQCNYVLGCDNAFLASEALKEAGK